MKSRISRRLLRHIKLRKEDNVIYLPSIAHPTPATDAAADQPPPQDALADLQQIKADVAWLKADAKLRAVLAATPTRELGRFRKISLATRRFLRGPAKPSI